MSINKNEILDPLKNDGSFLKQIAYSKRDIGASIREDWVLGDSNANTWILSEIDNKEVVPLTYIPDHLIALLEQSKFWYICDDTEKYSPINYADYLEQCLDNNIYYDE